MLHVLVGLQLTTRIVRAGNYMTARRRMLVVVSMGRWLHADLDCVGVHISFAKINKCTSLYVLSIVRIVLANCR